jgi:hypothetical protein
LHKGGGGEGGGGDDDTVESQEVVVGQGVPVPSEALRGMERVQAYPGVDKYSAHAVVQAAMVLKEVEALLWVSANPSEYMRGLFDGFIGT